MIGILEQGVTATPTPPSSYPLANIISEYKLDTNSNDFVGANNGTDTSMSYTTGGLVDDCADFTAGTTSQINFGNSSTLNFGNGTTDSPFSISFAVKFTSIGASTVLIEKGLITSASEYRIFILSGSTYFDLFDANRSNYLRINAVVSPVISLGVWAHFTVTYDGSGSNNGMEIYNNGVLVTPARVGGGTYVAMENISGNFIVGKNMTNTNNSLNGYMDVITIWDKELTATEVLDIATAELAGTDINP